MQSSSPPSLLLNPYHLTLRRFKHLPDVPDCTARLNDLCTLFEQGTRQYTELSLNSSYAFTSGHGLGDLNLHIVYHSVLS